MNVIIFVSVAIAFGVILACKRYPKVKEKLPETKLVIPTPSPECDDFIRILCRNPKEFNKVFDFELDFEHSLEDILNYYQIKDCPCNVEFMTVGFYLVAVIHVKKGTENKKRGIEKLWNRN